MTYSATVRTALRDAMLEEMQIDKNVFLIGEEVANYNGAYKVSKGLLSQFGPNRIIDTPITESGFSGLAVGAAFSGLRPIVEFMTFNFAMQAIDHIINSASKILYMSGGEITCPIVFRGPNGPSSRVGAQHSQCFASWYSHCPGLKVVAPYSSGDAKGLLKAAIRDPNPIIFLENELMYGEVFDGVSNDINHIVPLGKAKLIKEGQNITLITFSIMVGRALKASIILADKDISVEIIDLRTLRILDREMIFSSVMRTNRVIIVEEGWSQSGIGAEISSLIQENIFDYLDAPVKRITALDVPLAYAANLESFSLPKVKDIVFAVQEMF